MLLISKFPSILGKEAIEQLLPHRGPIFVCQRLTVLGPHTYQGVANWPLDHAVVQGHFPGFPLVPGVLLIEAATQLAGAGLCCADTFVQSLPGERVGVLASVRQCSFKQPVRPGQDVVFDIVCRVMGADAVKVTAQAQVAGREVAQIETLMVYVDRAQIAAEAGWAA